VIETLRKPEWLKIQLNTAENTGTIKRKLRVRNLNTVCKEARCPNLHECWSEFRTATFMILGSICTRSCRFCAVEGGKSPEALDEDEPRRVALTIKELGIEHAVITMVSRDDLEDGGANHLAATRMAIGAMNPAITVEYLSSDMNSRRESIATLVESAPDVIGHNLETVRRLTPLVRSNSNYDRSLDFLETAKEMAPNILIKSSIMLGLGEEKYEVLETMSDIKKTGCDALYIGQYLQPTRNRRHLPVMRYWDPDDFLKLKENALNMGFIYVEAGPMVRSSYHAGNHKELFRKYRAKRLAYTR